MHGTIRSMKIALENGIVSPGVDFECPRVQIRYVGNATLGRVSSMTTMPSII